MAPLRYLTGVVTLRLDAEKCSGCGLCAVVCPQGVFAVENNRARIADCDACMECGACARNCAFGAVTVRAGVGCATAVISRALGKTKSDCCCSADSSCCR